MSELNWNWVYYPYLDAPNKQVESALKAGYVKVVDKSEADKVIAELKESIKGLILDNYLKDKELRHNKYKRCLDKSAYWVAVSYQCVDNKHRQQAERHHKKWLELAEQFKEAK